MGKSTTANMFADEGIPVWDADETVRRLYAKGGAAVAGIAAICPQAIIDDAVDKAVLKNWIAADDTALGKIESVVHPLVAADRAAFIAQSAADIVVLDIPLLFETGGDALVDAIVVVSAPANEQRKRVLDRPNMTPQQFDTILAKQVPDHEKRARADYIVETTTLDAARTAVQVCLRDIRQGLANA